MKARASPHAAQQTAKYRSGGSLPAPSAHRTGPTSPHTSQCRGTWLIHGRSPQSPQLTARPRCSCGRWTAAGRPGSTGSLPGNASAAAAVWGGWPRATARHVRQARRSSKSPAYGRTTGTSFPCPLHRSCTPAASPAGGTSVGAMPCSSPVFGARTTTTGDLRPAPAMVTGGGVWVRAEGRCITGRGWPRRSGPGASGCSCSSSSTCSIRRRRALRARARGPRCVPRGRGRRADAGAPPRCRGRR